MFFIQTEHLPVYKNNMSREYPSHQALMVAFPLIPVSAFNPYTSITTIAIALINANSWPDWLPPWTFFGGGGNNGKNNNNNNIYNKVQ